MSGNHSTSSTPVVSYGRVSTSDQTTVPTQLEWARGRAREEGWSMLQQFSDQGISGSEIEVRPDLQQLLNFCERSNRANKPVQMLLVWTLDRLSRADMIATFGFLRDLRQVGVRWIVTNTTRYDLYGDWDQLSYILQQGFQCAGPNRTLAEHVLASMAAKARKGLWPGGRLPWGAKVEQNKLVWPEDERTRRIQWLFQSYDETVTSTSELAKQLQAAGVKPPSGKRWSPSAVRRILSNRAYAGDLLWNETHVGKYTQLAGNHVVPAKDTPEREQQRRRKGHKTLPTVRNAPEDIILVRDAFSALITRDRFDRVQQLLVANRQKRSPRRNHDWLLSELIFCGLCKQPLWCHPVSRKLKNGTVRVHQYVSCSVRRQDGEGACSWEGFIQHDEVLERVLVRLQEDLGTPQARAALQERIAVVASARTAELEKECQELEARLADLEDRVRQGNERYLQAPPDLLEDLAQVIRQQKALRDSVRANLETARGKLATARASIDAEQLNRALALVDRLAELRTLADPELLRNALHALVRRVEVWTKPAKGQKGVGRGKRHLVKRVAIELTPLFSDLVRSDYRTPHVPVILIDEAA